MMKTNSIYLKNFCQRRSVKILLLRLIALCILFLLCVVYNSAQTTTGNRQTKPKVSRTKPKVVVSTNNATNQDSVVSNNTAITVVNKTEADYLTGEASVAVNPKQPTVVRLGLAQNATSVVEFPSVDQIYYIHEGNPKLVTVFGSPTKETDRAITLYRAKVFCPPPSPDKRNCR